MNVRELINELSKYDLDCDVEIESTYGEFEPTSFNCVISVNREYQVLGDMITKDIVILGEDL